jgi:hypothetical protein
MLFFFIFNQNWANSTYNTLIEITITSDIIFKGYNWSLIDYVIQHIYLSHNLHKAPMLLARDVVLKVIEINSHG